MTRRVTYGLLLCSVLSYWLALTGPVRSETAQEEAEKAAHLPMVIKSKTLEVNNNLKIVIFTGDVNAKKDDLDIDCRKMLVYYESLPAQQEQGEVKTKIDRIVATGQVKVYRAEQGTATADKAVYYLEDEKIVLSGEVLIKQENDFVKGNRITIFLKENRSIIESSGDTRVKAVIFPKREKR
ncbi:MAG: lipopolysaccharide transport periplasmic protein LptA [Desulfobacterales bacterium]|nr:lipopolysaccharide transport periplasmic protein LptA [Desulfobacterales bacterium]